MLDARQAALRGLDLARMIIQQENPFNAEPKPGLLIAENLTPQAIFYVRSHGDVPPLGADHRIIVGDHAWDRAALERNFPARTVAATLQCAGNRRADLQPIAKTQGDPWGIGAIGNAEWIGVSLVDVLRAAGIDQAGSFVRFTAADEVKVQGECASYGVSIPMEKAHDPDVLIAWAMNGEPLSPHHGAPLRLIVPGYAGVRSIKWLTHIEVAEAPSDAPIQARDYKLFPALIRSADEADWSEGLTINSLPVTAAICEPDDGANLATGAATLKGYAMAYDRGVSRVEVSINGGANWSQAVPHLNDDTRWSWTRWELNVELSPGRHEIVVRAIDTAGQGQPEHPQQVWNFAGYLATSWHRIVLTAS